jgi:hypothetical protein
VGGRAIAVVAACAAWAGAPAAAAAEAPDGWTVTGSFRVRYEVIGDQFRPAPAARNDDFLSLRTTLFATYAHGPLSLGAELIDSRGYLQGRNSTVGTSEIDALELGQAYVSLDVAGAGVPGRLTAGRFTMDDGSRRLIARNRFRNTINAFTGVRLDLRKGADEARLFWTMPHQRRPSDADDIRDDAVQWDRESPDLQFFGGAYSHAYDRAAAVEVYAYGLREVDSARVATRNRRLLTSGVRLSRTPTLGAVDYDLEAAYQTGETRASTRPTDRTDLDVSAWFVHAEVGRTFQAPWSPRVALQLDLGSGDGSGSKYGRFDTLFGARRGEYGPTSLWGAVQRSNLRSPAVRVEVKPDPRWDAFAAVRGLWLDSRTDSFAATGVRDPSGRSGRFAGVQAEARARYWLVPKAVRLEAGAAWLFEGRFLETAPNAPRAGDARYGYADVTFTF